MNKPAAVQIKFSKSKLTLLFLGSLAFVGIGVWLMASLTGRDIFFHIPFISVVAGFTSAVFFGLCGITILKKLFDLTAGLTISEDGVFDNSTGVSAGFVSWADVLEVREKIIADQSYVSLAVKNPMEYIDREKSMLKRKMMLFNYKFHDNVIGLSTIGLQCKHNELKSILERKFEEFKSKNQ